MGPQLSQKGKIVRNEFGISAWTNNSDAEELFISLVQPTEYRCKQQWTSPTEQMEMRESTRITIGKQTGIGTHFTSTNNRKNGWVTASLSQHHSIYSAGSTGECKGQRVWCEVDMVLTETPRRLPRRCLLILHQFYYKRVTLQWRIWPAPAMEQIKTTHWGHEALSILPPQTYTVSLLTGNQSKLTNSKSARHKNQSEDLLQTTQNKRHNTQGI